MMESLLAHIKQGITGLVVLFVFLAAGSKAVFAVENSSAKKELVILNWSEYMDPELVKKFEQQHNVTVKPIYYESDDYRDNYMLETQGKGIDIIVVNGIGIRRYVNQNWIVPITEKEVPNLKHIDKKWLAMFESAKDYAVPYFWGTSGIAYRKDLFKGEVTSWNDLLQPEESLRGKISMMGASRDLIGAALLALGYSMNSTSFDELKQAKQLLLKQKPYVKVYGYINLDESSALLKGDLHMSMIYSGDALMLQEHTDNIAYVVPTEGSQLWVDYMVVSRASANKDAAYQFIDFINQPAHAAQQAEFVYYATPNKAAEKRLPAKFMADQVIYPSKEILDKSTVYKRLPPRVTRIRNEIYSRVTQ